MTEDNKVKKLDSYSILIASKYFNEQQDYINLICVNSKFKETTEKLRFNPIPITSLKLFPKIQTQYLYNKNYKIIEGIDNYEIWFKVNYSEYLMFKENHIKCHYVVYTNLNNNEYGKEIPKEVTVLGEKCYGAFNLDEDDAVRITNINIPFSIHCLNYKCFYYCTSLTTISLVSTLTSISDKCFYRCESLKSIILPSSITLLSNYCFANCFSLSLITLPLKLELIGDRCFNYCKALSSISLPSTLITIGKLCFSGCTSLTSIYLPPSLTHMGDRLFRNCISLKSIYLSSTLKSLGNGCFIRCINLTSIYLSSSLQAFGKKCFYGCKSLKTIDLPLTLSSLENGCFKKCKSLSSINIQPTVKKNRRFFNVIQKEFNELYDLEDLSFGVDMSSGLVSYSDSDSDVIQDSYFSSSDSDSEVYDDTFEWEYR
ncbi:hypothetical protein QTN25_004381 [Entamoeba marina]